ncbi:MAG: hypothetical protein IRY99_20730 [Isosphaeraceae bacterium]|nr:hypothetical protein [Isosphaeraceae bacterium]
MVFFGTFATALGVGLFTWGTLAGAVILLFAFAAHVASAADTIRQAAFPGFGRWVPTVSASVGLGFGCYAPALALAMSLAWPGLHGGQPRASYLINRWAYRSGEPSPGHWVWFEGPEAQRRGIAQILAGSGQWVDWSEGRLRVEGQVIPWHPGRGAKPPRQLAFKVPEDLVLVAAPSEMQTEGMPMGLMFLSKQQILGRAWAQMHPVWTRRLLL